MIAVLTGPVHVGKTTVCRAVAELAKQRGYCVRGILTPPILDKNGERLGIEVLDLATGEHRVLARVGYPNGQKDLEHSGSGEYQGPHVGPYYFDPEVLQWAQDVISEAIGMGCDLLIIDEIGRLELEQNTGFHQVLDLLMTSILPRCLLVVRETLLDAFRRRLPELEFIVFEVTVDNRRALAVEIAERLFLS
ncbi:MAG: nucleoside-triphosphatase [Candidatus Hadarchaeum sp.]